MERLIFPPKRVPPQSPTLVEELPSSQLIQKNTRICWYFVALISSSQQAPTPSKISLTFMSSVHLLICGNHYNSLLTSLPPSSQNDPFQIRMLFPYQNTKTLCMACKPWIWSTVEGRALCLSGLRFWHLPCGPLQLTPDDLFLGP